MKIETDREDDGRWIAEIRELPGVMAYGATEAGARSRVIALAEHVVIDRRVHGEETRSDAP